MGISFLAPHEHDPDRAARSARLGGRSSSLSRRRGSSTRTTATSRAGEVGEVLGRGPALMSGYWRNPDATAEALRDGWMHTGDLGYRDEHGYLYLVDRRNDKIVTGGENVFPSEVEDVIGQPPGGARGRP